MLSSLKNADLTTYKCDVNTVQAIIYIVYICSIYLYKFRLSSFSSLLIRYEHK